MVVWAWNAEKDRRNLAKHGLSLAVGVSVLNGDPLALSIPDPHPDGDRWRTIGSAGGVTILVVVHTEPLQRENYELGVIISVRKATATERRAYEEGLS